MSTAAASPIVRLDPDLPTVYVPIPLTAWTPDDHLNYRDRLVTRATLARWLNVPVNRLNLWARARYGPRPRRIGGVRLMYVVGEVLDFIQASGADIHPDVRKIKKPKSESLSGV